MKSYKHYQGKHEKFSIRKLNVGVVSLAIAAIGILALDGSGTTQVVKADEMNTAVSLVEDKEEKKDTTVKEEVATVQASSEQVSAAAVTEELNKAGAVPSSLDSTELQKQTNSTTTEVSNETNGNTKTITHEVKTPELSEALDKAKEKGLTINEGSTEKKATVDEAIKDNQEQAKQIQQSINDYEAALKKYEGEKKTYDLKKEQYDAAKKAFDDYQKELAEGKGSGLIKATQKLLLEKEGNAYISVDGVKEYITPDAIKRLGKGGTLSQYDIKSLEANDLKTDNPYSKEEDTWIKMKVGDTVTATYTNLTSARYGDKQNGTKIEKIVYTYKVISSTNTDQTIIARLHRDPTITMTVGSNTDSSTDPIEIEVTMKFYDKDGKEVDMSDGKGIISLSSLNHWTGTAYIDPEVPRPAKVQAKDVHGNIVNGEFNPYSDGGRPEAKNRLAVTKSGYAIFEGGAQVEISAANPLKFLDKDGKVTDSLTLTAIDSNGNEVDLSGQKRGIYNLDPVTGRITYTPLFKYTSSDHIEKVNIGNNEFIQIPGSSVTNQGGEVYSKNDNQYVERGSKFNGENTGSEEDGTFIQGWDYPAVAPYYYGSGAMILKDGKVTFSVSGNQKGENTVYWFALNSTIALPKDPGQPPVAPEAPKVPTVTWHKNQVVQTQTANKKVLTQKVNYIKKSDRSTVAPSNEQKVTFVTIHDSLKNTDEVYHVKGEKTDQEVSESLKNYDDQAKNFAGFTHGNNTQYDEVANPAVQNLHVVSNDAPNSDLTKVVSQSVTFESADTQYTVEYAHDTEEKDEFKKVKLTIRYHLGNTQPVPNHVEEVTWTRKVTVDKVTNEIVSETEWTPEKQNYEAVDSPLIAGYTANPARVDALKVEQEDLVQDVYYTADNQNLLYSILDQTTNETLVNRQLLATGDSDSDVTKETSKIYDTIVQSYVKKGYKVVLKEVLPTKFDKDQTIDQHVMVILVHTYVPITPDTPQEPDTPINPDDPNGPKWPKGTTKNDLEKVVTRTIDYKYAKDGSKAAESVTQTETYTRTIVVDRVTGQIVEKGEVDGKEVQTTNFAPKGSGQFDQVTSPAIAGYMPDKANVEAVQTTENYGNQTVTVLYTADGQKLRYSVVDETDQKTLEDKQILSEGDSGTAVPADAQTRYDNIVKAYEVKGYKLLSKDDLPATFDTDKDTDQHVVIKLVHTYVPITPDTPQEPDTPINPDDPNGPKWPKGTTKNDLEKVVTRTIDYKYAKDGSKAAESVTQTETYTRTIVVDRVTGQIVEKGEVDGKEVQTTNFAPKGSGQFDQVTSPAIAGYMPDKANVEAVQTTENYGNQTVTVTYDTVEQKARINYIDETENKTLESIDIIGKTGQKIEYSTADRIRFYERQGYVLVKDNFPSDATYDSDPQNVQVYTVILKHGTVPVGPKNPQTPNTPINPDDPRKPEEQPKWPSVSHYFKKVQSIVRYEGAGENTPKENVQEAEWTRTLILDKVTGKELSATEWASNKESYDEVKTPVVQKYVADKALVPTKKVTMENLEEVVQYRPMGRVIPIDENGKVIPNVEQPIYPNDPNDPTKALKISVPKIPGYTPEVNSVDPKDPTKDTPVIYRKDAPITPKVTNKPTPTVVQRTAPKKETAALPRTGEEVSSSIVAATSGLGLLLSSLVVAHKNRKNK